MALLPPVNVVPAANSTISTTRPNMSCTLVQATHTATQRAQWQYARDAAFTVGMFAVAEPTTQLRTSGSTSEAMPEGRYLVPNGYWYVRARAIGSGGVYGPWSGANRFTVNVAAPPVPTGITPSGTTETSQRPVLGGTVVAASGGRASYLQWQVSKNNSFPTNGGTLQYTQSPSQARTSGATTFPVPLASVPLDPGLWYIRARQLGTDGTTGAWSASTSFTVDPPAPPVPASILPSADAVARTWTPTLQASVVPASDNRTSNVQWQVSPDENFNTEDVLLFTDSIQRLSGTARVTIPFVSRLGSQGIWWVRARQIDEYGEQGAWSTPHSFTVNHQPAATNLIPSSGTPLLYQEDLAGVFLGWSFIDSAEGDTQSAYQVEIRYSNGGELFVGEKVESSTVSNNLIALPWATVEQNFIDNVEFQWRVKVWDSQDVEGAWSPWVTVIAWRSPAVEITEPAPGMIDNGKPVVIWSESGINESVLNRWQIRYIRNSDGVNVWATGWQAPYVETYQPPVNVLENEKAYRIEVLVEDRFGFTAMDAVNVETLYVAPPNVEFVVDNENYRLNGFMLVDWSATQADDYFIAWNIYRREYGSTNWELIYIESNAEVHEYNDWMVLTGKLYDYAVTQVADRSGLTFESAIAPSSQPTLAGGEQYWLIDPDDNRNNLLLFNVISDSFTDSIEQETYTIIGRGRRTDYGTDLGREGSITAQLRDRLGLEAGAQLEQLRQIKRQRNYFLLRNPFGQMIQITIGDLAIERVPGVGNSEYVDISFPYTEVF